MTEQAPDLEFRQAIEKAGITPPAQIVADGELYRFASNGKRDDLSGWYVFYDDGLPAGAFGCWRAGVRETWCAVADEKMTFEEREQQRKRLLQARAKREKVEAERREECRRRSAEVLESAAVADPKHPYLIAKGIKPYTAMQDGKLLVIPVYDIDGGLHGLQYISGTGSKWFETGTAKKNHFHLIGAGGETLVIAEGFATAATIREATGLPVFVAFDAGNLEPVARAVRRKSPKARIIIAADNDDPDDRGVERGIVEAEKAAKAVGATVLLSPTRSDFNDHAAVHGIAAVEEIFRGTLDHAEEVPPVQSEAGFSMRKNGLFWQDPTDLDKPEIKLSGPFEILAETRDVDGSAWGVLLHWLDHDGRPHEWAMPRAMLAGDGADVRKVLLDGGLYISPSTKARNLLNSYLVGAYTPRRARAVSRTGWHDGAFVLPEWQAGGADGERVLLQSSGTIEHAFKMRGSLAEWKEGVAALAVGNSRLILAICTALASPLLEIAGAESGGFHLRGASSTGKTTALIVGASVWGGGDLSGYVRSWRATSNGLEGVAAAHCDALLCLDELGQVAAREAGEVAYLLANGSGKSRAARDGSGRRPARWRLLFLSSGEISLADKVAEDRRGRRPAAGQQVRVVDLPADAGAGLGLFENLHGHADGDALARRLKVASSAFYGTPARRFIADVASNADTVRQPIRGFIEAFANEHCPAGADGQVHRVAHRFGLAAAAGELAIRRGLLPWEPGEAINGCGRCFRDWLDSRGGTEPAEIRDGIAQVRAFLEAHGESRFTDWNQDTSRPTINRVGFRRQAEGGGSEWFILPEAWRTEVCAGYDHRNIATALAERGLLIRGSKKHLQARQRLPGFSGPARCYHLPPAILGDGDE